MIATRGARVLTCLADSKRAIPKVKQLQIFGIMKESQLAVRDQMKDGQVSSPHLPRDLVKRASNHDGTGLSAAAQHADYRRVSTSCRCFSTPRYGDSGTVTRDCATWGHQTRDGTGQASGSAAEHAVLWRSVSQPSESVCYSVNSKR